MILLTHALPVSGNSQKRLTFARPLLSTCSMTTTTLVPCGLLTRSMAPPNPLIFPGSIQFARLSFSLICIAPSRVRSIRPDLICAARVNTPTSEKG